MSTPKKSLPPISIQSMRKLLKKRFNGRLEASSHSPDGKACVLEFASQLQGINWTDSPDDVGCVDLRPLNDMEVDDVVRAKNLLPVLAAYHGSAYWSKTRLKNVSRRLIILTVNRLLVDMEHMDAAHKKSCKSAATFKDCLAIAEYLGSLESDFDYNYLTRLKNCIGDCIDYHKQNGFIDIFPLMGEVGEILRHLNKVDNSKFYVRCCKMWLDAASQTATTDSGAVRLA